MQEKVNITIIVPIYNVKDYLQKCVDSLLHQDYDSYEIILVDDGSTDGSGAMADAIVEKWELRTENREQGVSVRVIHQENRGLSGARNTGIEAARGEYICFVDSDDYWEENVLGGLMEQVEREQLDVLRYDYNIVKEDGTCFWPIKTPKVYDQEGIVSEGTIYLDKHMPSQNYAWQFILKREIAKKCLFKEGIYFEDVEWTPRMLLSSERVGYCRTIVYNYLWRQGTISRNQSTEKKQKTLRDTWTLLEGQIQLKMVYPESVWVRRAMATSVLSILSLTIDYQPNEWNETLQRLNDMNVYPLETNGLHRGYARWAKIVNISPSVYKLTYWIRTKIG